MHLPYPITDEIVLIGGGHAHALVLKKWAMKPMPGVRLTVINPTATAPYTGMLPGHIAGHYTQSALEIDLVRLARHAGARLILGRATGIDRQAKRIQVAGRADVFYDLASVDIGITSEMPDIAGFTEYGHAAKPLGLYAAAWQQFLHQSAAQAFKGVVVIGGGVGGIELALAMAFRIGQITGKPAQVVVLEQSGDILDGLGAKARAALQGHMVRLGVRVLCDAQVTRITPDGVLLQDGTKVEAGFVVGAAGARPHLWLGQTGLPLQNGFIKIKDTLQSVDDPNVFAVGDCAYMGFAPRPKAGVFAVRQAPVLDHNLRAALKGGHLKAFRPQRDYLKLISTGGKGAVADKWRLRLDGPGLWRLKDRIDRKFMAQFLDLQQMPPPDLPTEASQNLKAELAGAEPLCGGCGAKMAATGLADVLADLPATRRKDVLSGPGDDAAILRHGRGQQVFTTDHLRAFVEDPYLMTEIAVAHALGDIWAMGASPQAALVQVILPGMAARLQGEMLREIMAAAQAGFAGTGADIVGGHTSIGAELTIGFSLTGLCAGKAIGLQGAKPGDALILTKPIGSGTILAAEMRKQAQGDDVVKAYRLMRHSQRTASALLAPSAHAMTDVTGFGLAGHLMAILKASNLAAGIDLAAVPVMEGALPLAQAGVRSSLWRANRQAIDLVSKGPDARVDLLFDPQTSGGLLAAVPADQAQALLDGLVARGEPAVIIGYLKPGEPGITL